ncbi:Acg family FMN-binding oxidoreductase [Umezawaea sp. Da 62-37]|uniref:Acg family FMN-binding oxidoreductase n=1 Tax=Umezawaea sp. Da 62-37 TaxID=3075927 RepID=UPI0028F6F4C9|nr:nitroreductase [Umezawaea sp. Da 62-37]WNV84834.1 nitroreductase [Umezawaea sp. Da 62-37]
MSGVVSALGLAEDDVRGVLEAASAAPSIHNSQPWRFVLHPDRIELRFDPDKQLRATDPDARELRLSCGAALLNARLALQGLGLRPLVTLLPGRAAQGTLAVIRRGGWFTPTEETRELLRAITARRTNRHPFTDAEVPVGHRQRMVRAAELERSWLHVVDDPAEQVRLRELIQRAHKQQLVDPDVQAELTGSTGDRADPGHGVPKSSAGFTPAPQDEWAFRDFSPGSPSARPSGKDYEPNPFVVVLCSFYDGPLGELQAGQALQRVLLSATALGLSASFMSQAIEVGKVREELRRALGGSLFPQTVLRLGFGSPVPRTPRLPVDDLVVPPFSVIPGS